MIDFSKNANYEAMEQKETKQDNVKRTKQTHERNARVDYDFADRDIGKQAKKEPTRFDTKPVSNIGMKKSKRIGDYSLE